MSRWSKGAGTIEVLLTRDELEVVPATEDTVTSLLVMAEGHTSAADGCLALDPASAYTLAYDAARKAATALLGHQGLRPTTRGGHLAVVDAMEAQFPGVPGLTALDRLRRRRNQSEYPDPAGHDRITEEEAREAISVARTAIDSARTLVGRPELGLFR